MAATAITGNQVAGIKYTWRTDTSLDWPSVPNGTYFFDLNTQQVYYKDLNSSIIDIFNSSGLSLSDVLNIGDTAISGQNINLIGAGEFTITPVGPPGGNTRIYYNSGTKIDAGLGGGSTIELISGTPGGITLNASNFPGSGYAFKSGSSVAAATFVSPITANRTYTFQDADGTVAFLSDIPAISKVAVTFTPGVAGSPNTITHNLGTSDIIVQLWDSVTGEVINADIDNATATTVDITFGLNPVGDVKAVII